VRHKEARVKGIPEKDGWYVMRENGQQELALFETWPNGERRFKRVGSMWSCLVEERDFSRAEFFHVPPHPDDGGDYAAVWVKKHRDADGKRTCNGCKLFGECDKAEVLKTMTVYKHDDPRYFAPGPDCPLGSDDAPTPDAITKAQVERIKKAQRLAKEQEIPFLEALKRIDDAPPVRT